MVNWEAKPWGGIGADMAYGGKKKTYWRNQLYILFPCNTCCRVKNGLTSRTTWKYWSNIEDHLPEPFSPFALCRRQEEPASDLPSGGAPGGEKKEKLPMDSILQDWDQDSSWPLRHWTEEQSDWLSPVSFWPQCPPRARLSPPSRDPGWSSRQAEKQKTRWKRGILMLKRKREDEKKNGLYR